jgi:4-hydroxy-tetrahydrodipicolinate reductase
MAVRVGIAGITGRMGREIAALATRDPEIEVVGGLSRQSGLGEVGGVPIVSDVRELLPGIDALIDFSSPDGVALIAGSCAAEQTPLVTGTTGLDSAQRVVLQTAAERVAVFQAANMSPGVNAILAVLPVLVNALSGYDLEIVETHHRYKADAPSGTALALGRAIADSSGSALADRARHGREGVRLRSAEEIGIHAVRAGGNPGEHTVILAGDGEEVRLSHRAFSRAAYAEGALRAARLIVSQPPGWYEPSTLPGFL